MKNEYKENLSLQRDKINDARNQQLLHFLCCCWPLPALALASWVGSLGQGGVLHSHSRKVSSRHHLWGKSVLLYTVVREWKITHSSHRLWLGSVGSVTLFTHNMGGELGSVTLFTQTVGGECRTTLHQACGRRV